MNGGKIKAIYIIVYMAFATWRVFYNVYLEENHFTGVQIGTINAFIQAAVFFIVPLWGVFADKRGIRPTLRIALLSTAVLVFFLGEVISFWWLLFYLLLLTLFYHPLGPLIDALAVQVSEKEKKYNFGNLRLWGSFGWAVASIAGGYLFMKTSLSWIFPISAILFICAIFFMGIPGRAKVVYRPHFERLNFKELARNRGLFVFLVILTLYGIASSPVNSYINLYFAELGASKSVIGLAYTIQALSELPFFLLGNRLLKRLGSAQIILISMFVMVLRMILYAGFSSIPVALATCVLQGITLSFLLVGVVDYLHKQLPQSRHATAQSLLWGLYFGLGHTIGNFLIGWLKDIKGMQGVMHVFIFITLGIFLITAVDFSLQKFRKQV